jgi:hypothetical protein
MKLYWSSRSPLVRKVMIAAHEVGIADRIRTQRVVVAPNGPNIEVMQDNPLGKIPTLVFDDGTSLYDSRVICEYPARAFGGADSHPLESAASSRRTPTKDIGVARFSRRAAALVTVCAGLHSRRIVREDTEEAPVFCAVTGAHHGGVVLCQAATRPDTKVDPVLLAFRKCASGDAAG